MKEKEGGAAFVFHPKVLELAELKIVNGAEEMTTEQMMIQSMANIQFEQLKSKFGQKSTVQVEQMLRAIPKQI